MAIYGIGAYYDRDISADFKNHNVVGTGWDVTEAPDLHEYFDILEPGDIVYLKAAAFGAPVTVKAIGLVEGPQLISGTFGSTYIEIGRNVQWLDKSWFKLSIVPGKNNVRANTMYRETHPDHIHTIMQKVEQGLKRI
ncbi:MAG: hypothetical protein V4687_13760 [Bacteroidota bacterium]